MESSSFNCNRSFWLAFLGASALTGISAKVGLGLPGPTATAGGLLVGSVAACATRVLRSRAQNNSVVTPDPASTAAEDRREALGERVSKLFHDQENRILARWPAKHAPSVKATICIDSHCIALALARVLIRGPEHRVFLYRGDGAAEIVNADDPRYLDQLEQVLTWASSDSSSDLTVETNEPSQKALQQLTVLLWSVNMTSPHLRASSLTVLPTKSSSEPSTTQDETTSPRIAHTELIEVETETGQQRLSFVDVAFRYATATQNFVGDRALSHPELLKLEDDPIHDGEAVAALETREVLPGHNWLVSWR